MLRRDRIKIAALALVIAAVVIRVTNALRYPVSFGFDSGANWRYVRRLTGSWALPAPDTDWATAHPPLFYYLMAGLLRLLGGPERDPAFVAVRLVSSLVGFGAVALAVVLVRRADPADARRALIAGALIVFLPVHIYMSAMFNEEILAASLVSLAVTIAAWDLASELRPSRPFLRAAFCGLAAGLALLTKFSGLTVVGAAALAYAVDGRRRRERTLAVLRPLIVVCVAVAIGGWYYARNQIRYGYVYPHGLAVHEEILTYPPGERGWLDYVRIPFDTFSDPRVLAPGLLRSVWGTTYASVWFDAHRHFLPTESAAVNRLGTVILLLAILPTAAFLVGLLAGLRRCLLSPRGPDLPLVLLVAATLAGYVLFTWRNPWFATAKGSYLLGLAVPFAYYASETLSRWSRAPRLTARAVGVALAMLFGLVTVTFTQGPVVWKWDTPGFVWEFPAGESKRVRPMGP